MQYSLGNMLKGGGALNPDGLSLDLAFALDKTLTPRKGPRPNFTRAQATSTGSTYVGSDGLIKYAAANEPRFDHDATGASKGLLIEESRINYIAQSENFANAWWLKSVLGIVSLNKELTIPDPAGGFNSTRVEVNAGFSIYRDPISSVPDGTRSVSIFARAVTGGLNSIALLGTGATVRINLATGAVIANIGTVAASLKVERFGGIGADGFNWWRISYATTTTSVGGFYIEPVGTVSGAATAFLIFGAQYEVGAFPTSYIPTATTSLTRSADVCSITGADFASFHNPNEFSALCDFSFLSTAAAGAMAPIALNQSGVNGVLLYKGILSSGVSVYHVAANSALGSVSVNVRAKGAFAYDEDSTVGVLDGGSVSPETGSSSLTFVEMTIGRNRTGVHPMSGHIARIQYFRKRLSNAKLQTLTAP